MDEEFKRFHFNSAITLLSGGTMYGEPIDTQDLEEVIAVLFFLYLQKDTEAKELKREYEFIRSNYSYLSQK